MKGKRSKLMALLVAGIMVLAGCSNGSSSAQGTEEKLTIGILQLAEHPALDDARKGFEDGLKELGVEADVLVQNAQGDIPNTVSISQKFVKDNQY